jgi:hypothetical protein
MPQSKAGRGPVNHRGTSLSARRLGALLCLLAGLCLPVTSYAQIRRHRQPANPPVLQPEVQPAALAPATPPAAPLLLEQKPSRLPTVTFQNGILTIVAYNATLSDILEMVHSETGATIDIPPDVNERVFVRLGPGPVRRVLDSLLVGSAYNYVMLGSAADPDALAKVVLTAKPKETPDKGTVNRASQVLPGRRESSRELSQALAQDRADQADPSALTEDIAPTVSKQEEAAKPESVAKVTAREAPESEPERVTSAEAANPRTPNIKTAQEVLQDLYARRRQAMEQQNQQQPPP